MICNVNIIKTLLCKIINMNYSTQQPAKIISRHYYILYLVGTLESKGSDQTANRIGQQIQIMLISTKTRTSLLK